MHGDVPQKKRSGKSARRGKREREREKRGARTHMKLYIRARIRKVSLASSGVTSSLTFTGFVNTSSPTR